MGISFTRSIINQLNKEIAEIQTKSSEEKKKIENAQSKINQLQRDVKLSTSAHDLNSKLSRINKLKENIKQSNRLLTELSKQLSIKNKALDQQLAKNQETKQD